MKRNVLFLAAVALAVTAGAGWSRADEKKPEPTVAAPSGVAGTWTGTWGIYSPPALDAPAGTASAPAGKDPYSALQRQMDCKVEALSDGKWQATFEGECGRPYKYTIKMLGRQAGSAVLFQGTADLGEKDGGVFDWIGRATEKEFVGFFTSKGYTGTFRLARPKAGVKAAQNTAVPESGR